MGMFYSNPSLQLSILSESIDNEINNFNKLLESINILNENNILLLEKVDMRKIKDKVKEIFGKIKAAFIKLKETIRNIITKIKEKMFKKKLSDPIT